MSSLSHFSAGMHAMGGKAGGIQTCLSVGINPVMQCRCVCAMGGTGKVLGKKAEIYKGKGRKRK